MTGALDRLMGITGWAKNWALDAPLVAVTWVEILRRGFRSEHSTSPTTVAALVFATVWLIYMFDRLMDVRWLGQSELTSDRHQFAKRNQRLLWPLWVSVGVLTVAAVFAFMDDNLRRVGLLHLGSVAVYFLFIHGRVTRRWRLPKEMVVGALFALGVSMTVARPWTLAHVVIGMLLSLLFSLNCLIVAQHQPASDSFDRARPFGRTWYRDRAGLRWLGFFVAGLAVLLMAVTQVPRLIGVSACASACLSVALCGRRNAGAVPRSCSMDRGEGFADAVLVVAPLVVAASWTVLGSVSS